MKTLNFSLLDSRCAAFVLIIAGLSLAGPSAYSAETSAAKKTVTLEDARLDEQTGERACMFIVATAVRPAKKLTLADAKADPEAAIREGLWDVSDKVATRKISLEEARHDPDAAKRARLWDIAVPTCPCPRSCSCVTKK